MVMRSNKTVERTVQAESQIAAANTSNISTVTALGRLEMFVARKRELSELEIRLGRMLEGNADIAFILGEAGQGKTTLLRAFAERIQRQYPGCFVAIGNCNAYTGIGDPHLPFREVLESLIRSTEGRSWHQQDASALSLMGLHAIATYGIDLLDTFVAARPLLEQFSIQSPLGDLSWVAPFQTHLQSLVNQSRQSVQQKALFEQYARVLQAIAQQQPIILLLDDLQWVDVGSIELLFHLGRQLQRDRILIVGAYRGTEVAIGREGKRHPLESLIHEFQQQFGDILIDLNQAEGRAFIEQLLDATPNHLDEEFRQTLFQQTAGHPLFTLELLRTMQERGDLVLNHNGAWIAQPSLDWTLLPARTEGAISERVKRLNSDLQELLQVASVMGDEFIAEVVAQTLNIDERHVVRQFSQVLDQTHQIVRSLGIQRDGEKRLSRYQFRHILIQRYLYNNLDEVERVYLNEAIARVLETLYCETREPTNTIALQLAWHYERSGLTAKATECLYQAGLRASQMAAQQSAIAHFHHALKLLTGLHNTRDRHELELKLQLALGSTLIKSHSYGSAAVRDAYARALDLCEIINDPLQRFLALNGSWLNHLARSEIHRSHQIADECWQFAQTTQDSTLLMISAWMQAETAFLSGNFGVARQHSTYSWKLYQTWERPLQTALYSQDPGIPLLVKDSCILWQLGYADQALQRSQEAIELALKLNHSYSLAFAQGYRAMIHLYRQEVEQVQQWSSRVVDLATDQGFSVVAASGLFMQGWAIAHQGNFQVGLAQMQQALADYESLETDFLKPHMLLLIAEIQGQLGQVDAALVQVEAALEFAKDKLQGFYEADSYRLKGELLLQQGSSTTLAIAQFEQAIAIAQNRHAKFQELRSVIRLCRLWQHQDKVKAARSRLSTIYHQFTEGFDTRDLQEAKVLLENLGGIISAPAPSPVLPFDPVLLESNSLQAPSYPTITPNAAFLERLATLTDRERELLNLIAQGLSNTQISEQLVISSKTVRNHITNIFSKLQVATRAEAIVQARNAGLG
ncbi:MAG TPA: hypothetical protein DDZ80_09405 [Cyanobacteria bacterium UBA8803]|nr:hypothetical protein [Cyanobacteria bacterium UBA9273]HBL58713.1 hypothetical protein [Cyanobacteria bacterium UBA8803]